MEAWLVLGAILILIQVIRNARSRPRVVQTTVHDDEEAGETERGRRAATNLAVMAYYDVGPFADQNQGNRGDNGGSGRFG